jgi:hypothetical protein
MFFYYFIYTVLSFSFLQSKEKERTAKKEKEKHAIKWIITMPSRHGLNGCCRHSRHIYEFYRKLRLHELGINCKCVTKTTLSSRKDSAQPKESHSRAQRVCRKQFGVFFSLSYFLFSFTSQLKEKRKYNK